MLAGAAHGLCPCYKARTEVPCTLERYEWRHLETSCKDLDRARDGKTGSEVMVWTDVLGRRKMKRRVKSQAISQVTRKGYQG